MDLIGEERGRLARAASWLEATPAEVVGLAVLLVSAVAVTGVLVWSALGRPALAAADATATAESGPEAADVGVAADAGRDDEGGEGPDPDMTGHDEAAAAGEPEPTGEVTVHVAGAVVQPGVVTLPAGSRVTDAVAAAGGLLPDADPSRVNLARQLQDGEQLVILRAGEEPPPPTPGDAAAASAGTASDGPVDLNTATVEQLQTLPGIGPALAQRIVRHRDEVGPFRARGDLRDVSGIGEKRFQDLADLVTVG